VAGGRPRREDNEICPKCGSPGYSYPVPSWNSRYKNGPKNWYLRFIHKGRSPKYCYVGKGQLPLENATEYNRKTGELTTFNFNREEPKIKNVIKRVETIKALTVTICSFSYVPQELKPIIRKLRKLKKFRLSKDELNWLLDKNVYQDLKGLSSSDIVLFGEEGSKASKDISDLLGWLGEIRGFVDKYGFFSEIQQIREKNNQIKITRKNLGHKESPAMN
jgi:hypothetical protein